MIGITGWLLFLAKQGKTVMADGVSGVGNAPFNVGSDIHAQTRARERIETHLCWSKEGRERTQGQSQPLRGACKAKIDLQESL